MIDKITLEKPEIENVTYYAQRMKMLKFNLENLCPGRLLSSEIGKNFSTFVVDTDY